VEPPDLPLRLRRGQLSARAGIWDRAAADFAMAFVDHDPEEPYLWLNYARTLVLRGETASYHRLCTQMLAHANHDDPAYSAAVVARVCTLTPGGDDLTKVMRQLERHLTQRPGDPEALYALGMVHYRAGAWDQALQCMQESANKDPAGAWARWPVLALIHQKLGHVEDARRWLDKASQWRCQELCRIEESAGFASNGDWPEFEIRYAEATTLLSGKKP
jgi:uncharacterized protein HemY